MGARVFGYAAARVARSLKYLHMPNFIYRHNKDGLRIIGGVGWK